MPIPVVELKFDSSDAIDIHCPACGTALLTKDDSDAHPCPHVDFIYFPAGDIDYVREDLEAEVTRLREEAEAADDEFDYLEALCERRDDPTSFALSISWEGMPETIAVGLRLGSPRV